MMVLLRLMMCLTMGALATSGGSDIQTTITYHQQEQDSRIARSLQESAKEENATHVFTIINTTTYIHNASYPDNTTTAVFINTTDAVDQNNHSGNTSLTAVVYKGRFQMLADGCQGPPPLLQAACSGTNIRFALENDATKIACEPSLPQDLPLGFSSGLTCRALCNDPNHANQDECASAVYTNDGGYSTKEGPWGEVIYYCLGETLEELDSVFRYLDTGDGGCSWRLFFDNRLFHLAQLGVYCPNNQDHFDAIQAQEDLLIVSVSETYPFTFDDTYFECSQGDSAAIDFTGPRDDNVLCAVGQSCAGEDCTVAFHDIHVHADLYRLADAGCAMMVDSDGKTVPLYPDDTIEVESPYESTLPPGKYTIVFQAGWSMLLKNPDYWYNLDDIECQLLGDNLWLPLPESDPEPLPPISITCPNGTISLIETEDSPSKSIRCEQATLDTLHCYYNESVNWQSLSNTFTTVLYECTTRDQFPTTIVTHPPNNVTCVDEIYDDLVVGFAIQLGHFCRTDPAASQEITVNSGDDSSGNYQYDDFSYECGLDNHYLFLDENTNSPGDRFTCLWTIPIPNHFSILPLNSVSMTTDWRDDESGASAGPDPLCYKFLSSVDKDSDNSTATVLP